MDCGREVVDHVEATDAAGDGQDDDRLDVVDAEDDAGQDVDDVVDHFHQVGDGTSVVVNLEQLGLA